MLVARGLQSIETNVAKRRTKIVATIGPASRSDEGIDRLLDSGMDVARLNCAHLSYEDLEESVARLRRRAGALGRAFPILADLAGPKLRLDRLADGRAVLTRGDRFRLMDEGSSDPPQRGVGVVRGVALSTVLEVTGQDVVLADGEIRLRVDRVGAGYVDTTVKAGGVVTNGKGLAVPGVDVGRPAVTSEDWKFVDVLARLEVDLVGVSYVTSSDEVKEVVDRLSGTCGPAVAAKIETPQTVDDLDRIVEVADVVMVARGDLGVECPIEKVGVLQKRIVQVCRDASRPFFVATQLLASMTETRRPTRAEASDITNAVLDGAAGIVLSDETAIGEHPGESVRMAAKIIDESERYARASATEGSRPDQ